MNNNLMNTSLTEQIRRGEFGENADRPIIGWGIIGKQIYIQLKPAE